MTQFPDWASNFYRSPITFGSLEGPTVEHAYQACKTEDLGMIARIRNAATPGEAKRLGRKATLRPGWEQHKYDVMLVLLRRKFREHPELAYKLIEFEGELVEWNLWHDNVWGVCNCAGCPGIGSNLLGKALTQIREELLK